MCIMYESYEKYVLLGVGHCRHPGISRQAVDLMRGIKIDTLIDHQVFHKNRWV